MRRLATRELSRHRNQLSLQVTELVHEVYLEQALGPDHPRLAIALRRYADCLAGQGHDAQATPLHERAIGMFERTVGPSHHLIAGPLLGLARVRVREGARGVALELAERALAANQAGFGENHPVSVEARELVGELGGH